MKRYSGRFIIKSSRIKNWDYSTPGIYFVTICTEDHEYLFGTIDEGKIAYSKSGEVAVECLKNINIHFDNVCLKAFVVMPNHVHLLLQVETPYMASLQGNRKVTLINYDHSNHPNYFPRINQKSKQTIPLIIQQFKSAVTRKIGHNEFFGWQPLFYDEIIRDEKHLLYVKNYIINNIKNWKEDNYYKQFFQLSGNTG